MPAYGGTLEDPTAIFALIDSCENRGTSSAQLWTGAPHKVNTAAAPHSRRMIELIHFSYFG
jgi:hypothetical protein